MLVSLTTALVTVAVLGLLFSSTRKLGIVATGLLCVFYPLFVIVLLLIAGALYLFITRKLS